MRILLLHREAKFFAGTETLLGYFLSEMATQAVSLTVGLVERSRVREVVPEGMPRLDLPSTDPFSLAGLLGQLRRVWRAHRAEAFDLIHGWAARDWELAVLAGGLLRRPAVGTLHDHPQAAFIRPNRRRLMRLAAGRLTRLVCVSRAVQQACREAGYAAERLQVIHNGITPWESGPRREAGGVVRLGFLGVLSERKGLRTLFDLLSEFARLTPVNWELQLAGAAVDAEGRRLVDDIHQRYRGCDWWPRVQWVGWVSDPREFLRNRDLLVCPSSEFEPFGLVICEAALAGIPALAARQGGMVEIVEHDATGWLYAPGDVLGAARLLANVLADPDRVRTAGQLACQRIRREFSSAKMVAGYRDLYSTIVRDV